MSKVKFSTRFTTRNSTPRSSTVASPLLSRSQRNTHHQKQNHYNQFTTQFISAQQSPTNKNYVNEKSQILMRVDSDIQQKIKQNLSIQRMNSNMSIEMRRTKFKINRTKSSFKMSQSFRFAHLNSSFLNRRKDNKMFCSIDNRKRNKINGTFSQILQFQSFRSYLNLVIINHPKRQKERKTETFVRNFINYFIRAQETDIQKQLSEIKSICKELALGLTDSNHKVQLGLIRLIDRDISKLLMNMCLEVLKRRQRRTNNQQLLKINKEIEYSARRLKFFQLVLRTSLDIGQIYCDMMEYEKAFEEYSNAVKLAIFINDRYYQQIAIDKLGICKYYMGDTVSALYFHNNLNHISSYDLTRIKNQYSNQKEIQRLIDQKKKFKPDIQYVLAKSHSRKKQRNNLPQQQNNMSNDSYSQKIDVGEFTFQKQIRDQLYPINNNLQLKSNLKKIIKLKDLKQKVNIMKRSLKKNDGIGVKKYCGQTYVIPTINSFLKKQNNFQMNEVCLSHRSYNRCDTETYNSNIDRDSTILVTLLNYFINQNFFGKQN